jgi:hypothetical protein
MARRRCSSLDCWIVLVAGSAGLAACSAENGTGSLQGTLEVPACEYRHEGNAWIPKTLSEVATEMGDGNFLSQETIWKFFVAQPIDAPGPIFPADHPQNQIVLRMQNRSGGWDAANAVFFWVLDSYEVGRCARGRMAPDGTPDWDQSVCDRSTGERRMLIGTQGELVTSHFVLRDTCPNAGFIAEALGACDKGNTCPEATVCPGRGSWISFSSFGSAQSTDTNQALSPDFKINIDDTITASAFHVELCDESTIEAVEENTVPVPPPAIRGSLDGSFSFKLESSTR